MPLSLIPPTLPEDYCELSEQEQANVLIGGTQVVGSIDPTIIFSFDELDVDDRDKAWGKLNADGTFSGKIFKFANGVWSMDHLYQETDDIRILWYGTEGDLWSFDGGDGSNPAVNPPSGTNGAMWEVDVDFSAKFPVGPGTTPNGTVINQGSTGGTDETQVSLVAGNVPPHKHYIGVEGPSTIPAQPLEAGRLRVGGGLSVEWQANATTLVGETRTTGDGLGPTPTPITIPTLPPYRGIYFAKRTARVAYTP